MNDSHPNDDLEDVVGELLAKQAITEVLHRYCRGIDRMDREMAGTVWHPDGTADYGEGRYQGSGSGFLDYVWAQHAAMISHSHQIGNILIEVDLTSGTAGSESYVSLWARMPGRDGLVRDIFGRCRYVDRWSRRGGRWAIDHRVTLYDMTRVTERAGAAHDPGFCSGKRDRSDPSYLAI